MLMETLRLRRALQLEQRLMCGKKITDEELREVLGPRRWSQLQSDIDALRERRLSKQAMPAYLTKATKRYTDQLCTADRLEALAEKARDTTVSTRAMRWKMLIRRLRFGPSSKQNYRTRAERAYETAVEILMELADEFPEVLQFLDRHAVFDGDDYNVTPDAASVPRLRSSRSRHAQKKTTTNTSIRMLKINAIQNQIQDLKSNS